MTSEAKKLYRSTSGADDFRRRTLADDKSGSTLRSSG